MTAQTTDASPRVLVVDDTPQNIRLLDAVLSPRGYTVIPATSGQEALNAVAEAPPDIILLDIQMPVMDGVEATHLIKSRWPAIKVIVLTVQATRRGEALAAGAATFLLKGDGLEALQQAILN